MEDHRFSDLFDNAMFDNIGGKIKKLAKFICIVGIIISIITGIVMISSNMAGAGFLTMIVGALMSWVGTFVLYGFGELVENSDILVNGKRPEEPEKKEEKADAKVEKVEVKAEDSGDEGKPAQEEKAEEVKAETEEKPEEKKKSGYYW